MRCGNCRTNHGESSPHITRQADKINLMLAQSCDNFAIMRFPFFPFGRDHQRIEPALSCSLDALRIRSIRNYNRDASIRNATGGNVICNGNKVRPASGEKDSEILHAGKLATIRRDATSEI